MFSSPERSGKHSGMSNGKVSGPIGMLRGISRQKAEVILGVLHSKSLFGGGLPKIFIVNWQAAANVYLVSQ